MNYSLLNGLSIGHHRWLESLYANERNPIQGKFFNALQNVSGCFENCFPIREFVFCQKLIDVAEEIRNKR
jgi:hypothetical protein